MSCTTEKVIVMVDDEKAYVELLAARLAENLDRRVVAFTRPLDALAALPSLAVGVVVTDYSMPQLNGFEFAGQVSRLLPGVPCILITGHAIDLADAGEQPALRTMLQKPFGWRELAEEIVHWWPGPDAIAIKPAS
jgi:DNA-binding NtrC family response regulator